MQRIGGQECKTFHYHQLSPIIHYPLSIIHYLLSIIIFSLSVMPNIPYITPSEVCPSMQGRGDQYPAPFSRATFREWHKRCPRLFSRVERLFSDHVLLENIQQPNAVVLHFNSEVLLNHFRSLEYNKWNAKTRISDTLVPISPKKKDFLL